MPVHAPTHKPFVRSDRATDMADLTDATALVTGASSGIGREAARSLAAEGADVALAARREGRLVDLADELEAEHDVEALAVPTDVSVEAEVEDMVERTVGAFDRLDVVVNNAGVGNPGRVDEAPTEAYRRLMGVNVDGMFYTTRAALSHLRDAGGILVFVASFAGRYPRPESSIYAASKWWTRGFAHSLAGTVGEEGVAVSVVNPSEVRTEIGDGYEAKDVYDPGEVTEPEAVGEAIAFAASQSPTDTAFELDLYRRNKFAHF